MPKGIRKKEITEEVIEESKVKESIAKGGGKRIIEEKPIFSTKELWCKKGKEYGYFSYNKMYSRYEIIIPVEEYEKL